MVQNSHGVVLIELVLGIGVLVSTKLVLVPGVDVADVVLLAVEPSVVLVPGAEVVPPAVVPVLEVAANVVPPAVVSSVLEVSSVDAELVLVPGVDVTADVDPVVEVAEAVLPVVVCSVVDATSVVTDLVLLPGVDVAEVVLLGVEDTDVLVPGVDVPIVVEIVVEVAEIVVGVEVTACVEAGCVVNSGVLLLSSGTAVVAT